MDKAASVILLPSREKVGAQRSDEGAHRPVRALVASSTDGGGYRLRAPSSVGPQADTFSREREKDTEDETSYAIDLRDGGGIYPVLGQWGYSR